VTMNSPWLELSSGASNTTEWTTPSGICHVSPA